jgi:hypothetical protein
MEGNASAEIVLPIAKWGIDVRSYAQKAKTSCALLALVAVFVQQYVLVVYLNGE